MRSHEMKRNPRKICWTVLYRRKHKKGLVSILSKTSDRERERERELIIFKNNRLNQRQKRNHVKLLNSNVR